MDLAVDLELFHAALLYTKSFLGIGAVRYERALLHGKIVLQCSIETLLRGRLGAGGNLAVELELFHAALLLLELLLFWGLGFEVLYRGLRFILFWGLGSPVSESRNQGCSCFGVLGFNNLKLKDSGLVWGVVRIRASREPRFPLLLKLAERFHLSFERFHS